MVHEWYELQRPFHEVSSDMVEECMFSMIDREAIVILDIPCYQFDHSCDASNDFSIADGLVHHIAEHELQLEVVRLIASST